MEDIKQRKLDLLEETIKTYNLNNRCTDESGKCYYSPKSLGLEGISPGCGIGRLLTPELQEELDATVPEGVVLNSSLPIANEQLFAKLPQELKELGPRFLSSLQQLHDYKGYWDENGLSDNGRVAVEKIKTMHNLN